MELEVGIIPSYGVIMLTFQISKISLGVCRDTTDHLAGLTHPRFNYAQMEDSKIPLFVCASRTYSAIQKGECFTPIQK